MPEEANSSVKPQNVQENVLVQIIGKVGYKLDEFDMSMLSILKTGAVCVIPHDNFADLVEEAVCLFHLQV